MLIILVLLNFLIFLAHVVYRRLTIFGNLGFYCFSMILVYHFLPALFHGTEIAENPLHALFGIEVHTRWLGYLTITFIFSIIAYNLAYGKPLRDPKINRLRIVQEWKQSYNYSRPSISLFLITTLAVLGMYVFLMWRPMAIGYWIQGITGQFFNELLQFSSFVIIANHGVLFFIPVAIVQSLFYIATTQRLLVIVGLMAAFFQVHRHAYKFQVASLIVTGILAASSFLLIYSAREQYGREYLTETNLATRLKAVASSGGEAEGKWPRIANEFFQRIDGNLFALMVMQSVDSGNHWAGMESIQCYWRIIVPRFLNKAKQDTILELEEETFLINHYMVPVIDYLPTLWGTFYSYYGLPTLLAGGVGFAALLGWLDRKLTYRSGIMSLVLTNYLIIAIGFYEQGPRPFFINGRGTILLLFALFLLGFGTNRRAKQQ